ncbi:MAG: MASE1 domain-containing protein [Solirubrobacteraceae bacterium]
MSTPAQFSAVQSALGRARAPGHRPAVRYLFGVVVLAAAYYGSAKVGQTLRYTASVSAVWPPAGLGIAALYLWGVRWWPGVLIAELVVNGELLFGQHPLPLGSLVGQQAGNMAEVVVGAVLLRRLIGPRAAVDRREQVGGLFAALAVATAISATVGMVSMLAGGVVSAGEAPTFWRTWWLGDFAGALVVVPLMLAWASDPGAAWRRLRTAEGALLLTAVATLGALAVSTSEPVTYVVFPALIWAASRFGTPGGTLSIAIAAAVAIGITANDVGPFFKQPIDHRTLSTQVYIVVTAMTTLFLAAVVSERERSARQLAQAKRREGEQAVQERHRIARDLHDSVSQALFSTLLHTRTAEKALARESAHHDGRLARDLEAIGELTLAAQTEIRSLIAELGRDPLEDGLVPALLQHATRLARGEGPAIEVHAPDGRLAIAQRTEAQVFGIGREALGNVVKHAQASTAWISVEERPGHVVVEIRDDGCGFEPDVDHPGHFGLESMRSRAAEIGAQLSITSGPGQGTVVRIEAPAEVNGRPDGA